MRDVTLIPLTSQSEAQKAIDTAQKRLAKIAGSAVATDAEETDGGDDVDDASVGEESADAPGGTDATADPSQPESSPGVVRKGTSFAKDVIQNQEKGYGRFAQRWFSRNGSKGTVKQQQGLPDEGEKTASGGPTEMQTDGKQAVEVIASDRTDQSSMDGESKAAVEEASEKAAKGNKAAIEYLAPRLVRTAQLYFSTSGFFFSYDHDLSGTLTQRNSMTSDVPLWKRFDTLFFWNRNLIAPFISADRDELIIPLMQGFVGQRTFSIAKTEGKENDTVGGAALNAEEVVASQATPAKTELSDSGQEQHEFVLTLISRRSVKRAGLRYMRRGVDDDGNVANSVETEQILSPMTWDPTDKTYSLVQIRGSIPLHFTQNPQALKPTPLIYGSVNTNHAAFKKHLSNVAARYGDIQIVSLIDTHPPEVSIGQAFEGHSKQLNDEGGLAGKRVGFEWFDFHGKCKGMKFENVSILMDTLDGTLKRFGWIVKQNDRNIGLQTGVVRTNCMDCLDRTNVVQSSIGAWALEQQLKSFGLSVDLRKDPKTQWFNTLWADNGDSISKQYAGTAALKGDFTRTRKRNWTGALSDFSLTMNRYYNNMFGDYFMQTCIDYFLGNAGSSVFDDFETDMMSKDYALDIKRIRQSAIDTCARMVIEDPDEVLIGGWTMSCPKEANTLRTLPFEECVVLLTKPSLYFCRFQWDTDKVEGFEKVDLGDIQEIWRGAYITSALGEGHLDETKNYGFALRYKTTQRSIIRRNTRSLQNEGEVEDENSGKNEIQKQAAPEKDNTRLLAFKALPPSSSAAKHDGDGAEDMSETQLVTQFCDQLCKAAEAVQQAGPGSEDNENGTLVVVQERDVISVAEAKKNTGYVESIGYSLKRLVWS